MKMPFAALLIAVLIAGTSLASAQSEPELAAQLFSLTNQQRAAAHLPALRWDDALAAAALRHARRMSVEPALAHQYPGELDLAERAAQSDAHFSLIEENIGIGPSAAALADGWLRSSPHRANLLHPQIDSAGIAVVRREGNLYAVVDFSRSVVALSGQQVEQAVARRLLPFGTTISANAADARRYCNQPDSQRGFSGDSSPDFLMRWQGPVASDLPQPLVDHLRRGHYAQAAVASCPAQPDDGTFTVYRVAVLLYE